MKILVTGSTGRIGANLAKRLLEKWHEIRGFVYPGDAGRGHKLDRIDRAELMEGDLRDYNAVEKGVQGMDAIYHLAAAFGGPYSNIEYLQVEGDRHTSPARSRPGAYAGPSADDLREYRGNLLGSEAVGSAV